MLDSDKGVWSSSWVFLKLVPFHTGSVCLFHVACQSIKEDYFTALFLQMYSNILQCLWLVLTLPAMFRLHLEILFDLCFLPHNF